MLKALKIRRLEACIYTHARSDMQIKSYTQRPGQTPNSGLRHTSFEQVPESGVRSVRPGMQMSTIQRLDWPIGVNQDGTKQVNMVLNVHR